MIVYNKLFKQLFELVRQLAGQLLFALRASSALRSDSAHSLYFKYFVLLAYVVDKE